jgi:predicted nucleic acid-binding protein
VSKRLLVDTNLIVRVLVQDHEKHAKAAGRLFEACIGFLRAQSSRASKGK